MAGLGPTRPIANATPVSQREDHVTTRMVSHSPDAPASTSGGVRKPGNQQRIGDYVLLEEVGRGGMGMVFRAYDVKLHREVAIKTLLPSLCQNANVVARFGREARASARLRHPNIVALHHVGDYRGLPYLVMDFVKGETWHEVMKSQRPSSRRAAQIVKQVAEALNHAHRAGITHRDVKPQNVMIDDRGRPLLMDFGLARDSTSEVQMTKTGQLMGTPAYMAPEQVRGSRGDARTDVYALGVMLYQALAGRLPFRASHSATMLKKVLFDEPQSLRDLDSKIHPDLETIVVKCMQKEPEQRYLSAGEVARDLRRFLAGEAILARPLGLRQKGARWVRSNRALSAALAVMVVVVVVALVGGIVMSQRNQAALVAAEREAARREERARLQAEQRAEDREELVLNSAARLERAKIEKAHMEKLEKSVTSVLRRARRGEIFTSEFESNSALFTLIQYPEPRTVELVLEELDAITKVLSRGFELSVNQEKMVHFLCQALPGLGSSERSVAGLGRYLRYEEDELRAVFACLALCHLGGDQAKFHVEAASRRFDPKGPFPAQMRLAGVTFGEEERVSFNQKDAMAFAHRGLQRYLDNDMFGAFADMRRVADIDPSILYGWLTLMSRFGLPTKGASDDLTTLRALPRR